jgi:hypothetical protein
MDDRPTAKKRSLRGLIIAGLLAIAALLRVYGIWLNTLPDLTVLGGAVVAQSSSRRDYSRPRRPQAKDWWEKIVPHMREHDLRRFVRNFRVPPSVIDEIVIRASTHPAFIVSSWNVHRSESVSKKVHMTLWRLGRPAALNDCCELFGVSEGFVDKWTPIVLNFIQNEFGGRLWDRLPAKADTAAWDKLASEFEPRAGFPNCVGAGDGVLLPIYYTATCTDCQCSASADSGNGRLPVPVTQSRSVEKDHCQCHWQWYHLDSARAVPVTTSRTSSSTLFVLLLLL